MASPTAPPQMRVKPGGAPAEATPEQPPPLPVEEPQERTGRYRSFSVYSAQKLDSLDEMEADLREMQRKSADAEAELGGAGVLPVSLRTELSVLHGNANKLLATRVDAVITGGTLGVCGVREGRYGG